jgi:HNH endonuclease
METSFLEFHHVEPYARGGPATVENIQLRCRAHNAYEASMFFGAEGLEDVHDGWSP